MSRIEFDLAQGWSKNLQIVFEDKESSRDVDLSGGAFLSLKQVHGKRIVEVDDALLRAAGSGPVAEADGFIARGELFKSSRKKLVIRTADCVPLIMVDAKSEAVVALHAGWRGLQQGIHLLPFANKWLDPKSTWTWIGPSLNGENFDVRADMWSQFKEQNDRDIFVPGPDPSQRRFFPWRLIEADFKKIGVELVYNVESNTLANPEWASYRRATLAGLLKSPDFNLSWVGFS